MRPLTKFLFCGCELIFHTLPSLLASWCSFGQSNMNVYLHLQHPLVRLAPYNLPSLRCAPAMGTPKYGFICRVFNVLWHHLLDVFQLELFGCGLHYILCLLCGEWFAWISTPTSALHKSKLPCYAISTMEHALCIQLSRSIELSLCIL